MIPDETRSGSSRRSALAHPERGVLRYSPITRSVVPFRRATGHFRIVS
jgi:hypothetical protein